jgi:endonuclease/exonuclease/phosphatase family metal-dependent hydrolase
MKLKILSYNIHKGFTITNKDFILDGIRQVLREIDADVLFLQEVLGDHQLHKIPEWQTAIQFEYLADTVWPHFAYGKNAVYQEGHHGNAILSKYPIIDWSNHVISTNRLEQRGLLKARIQIPSSGQELVLANTHLDLTQKGRNKQADMLIRHMLQEGDFPWVLVGDFNDWNKRISPMLESQLNAVEVFRGLHGDYPRTFPSFMPMLSLDRVFVHKLRPVSAVALKGTKWKKLSDHLPLYVELDLAEL